MVVMNSDNNSWTGKLDAQTLTHLPISLAYILLLCAGLGIADILLKPILR